MNTRSATEKAMLVNEKGVRILIFTLNIGSGKTEKKIQKWSSFFSINVRYTPQA